MAVRGSGAKILRCEVEKVAREGVTRVREVLLYAGLCIN